MRSRGGRWLLYPVLAVLAIASVGGGYETVRESLDARAYPMPGQLVDVGGHRLHLHCTGSGSPTVVLEPGRRRRPPPTSPGLRRRWPATPRVCVYDRAGRGWSDAADGPQDGTTIAADLHTLLERAHVPGPYVLAGHSFGGLYVQSFAAQFPDQVAGMVLLDSTAPKPGPAQPTNTDPTTSSAASPPCRPRPLTSEPDACSPSSPTALFRHAPGTRPAPTPRPPRTSPAPSRSIAEANTAMQQASALTSLNGKPLIVLTADEGNTDDQWQSKQDHMATLSTNSLHRHANATHESLLDDEADSAAASQAIRDVVDAVRTSRPLAPR